MNHTKIEWVKNPDGTQGYTWNPITGCLNGCEYCYARRLANGRLRKRYLANQEGIADLGVMPIHLRRVALNDPFYPRFWEDRFEEMTPFNHEKKPRGIFVCDMSDLFGIGIPEEWIRRVFETINDHPEHRFYLLTKQPQNLIKFSPFPDNCWVGVTATNTEMFMQACSHLEYPVQAKLKYISIEPFLNWDFNWNQSYLVNLLKRADIGWLIIGTQTKPYKPPKIEWVEEIVRAADQAGISVFLKNNLYPLLGIEGRGKSMFHTGHIGELKQEMPQG